MEIKRMTDFQQIEEIYVNRMQQDFPANEIKPLISIEKALENGIYECYSLYSGRINLGYAFFVRVGSCCLLDYFAVTQSYRNKGYGSVFLNRLSRFLTDMECVICEVDDPQKKEDSESKKLCERRRQFYLRNGFRETNVTSTVFGADFQILVTDVNKTYSDNEIAECYAMLYQKILPEFFFKTCFTVYV